MKQKVNSGAENSPAAPVRTWLEPVTFQSGFRPSTCVVASLASRKTTWDLFRSWGVLLIVADTLILGGGANGSYWMVLYVADFSNPHRHHTSQRSVWTNIRPCWRPLCGWMSNLVGLCFWCGGDSISGELSGSWLQLIVIVLSVGL